MRRRLAERCRAVAPTTLLPPLAVALLAVVVFGLGQGPVQQAGASSSGPRPGAPAAAPASPQDQVTRERCARLTRSLKRYGELKTFGDHGRRIGVIGDSYTAGEGLKDRSERWVARLAEMVPARVRSDGVGFTGFVSPGPCGGQRYATRTGRMDGEPVVLVEGGLNDLRAPAQRIAEAAADLVHRLHDARVIVIGPPDVPARTGERRVDAALRRGARAAGAEYLSMLPLRASYLGEGLHLTRSGHAAFARRVAGYLRDGSRG